MRAVLDHVAGRVPVIVAATHFASNICGARGNDLPRVRRLPLDGSKAVLHQSRARFRAGGLRSRSVPRRGRHCAYSLRAPADADTGIHKTYGSGPLGAQSGRNRRGRVGEGVKPGDGRAVRHRCAKFHGRRAARPRGVWLVVARGPLSGHRHARVPVGEARGAIDRDAPHGACRKNMVGRLLALTSHGRSPEAPSGRKPGQRFDTLLRS
jgi:hypothetical protein